MPVELIASPVYRHVRTRYAKLAEIVGHAAVHGRRTAKRTEAAETFDELRAARRSTLAKEGIQLSRFKGLGEMNADAALGDDDGPGDAGC